MYLQVLTVADLTDAKGTHINQSIRYKGSKRNRDTTYIKIEQEDLPSSSWDLWYEVIYNLCDENGKLYNPLGDWIVKPEEIRMKWEFMYSPSVDCIFHTPTLQALYPTEQSDQYKSLPDDSIPIDSVTFIPSDIQIQPQNQVIYPLTLEETIDQLDPWERNLLQQGKIVLENVH